MPKYLLRLRKTSFLLMFRNSPMSLGSNKASSKDEATWHLIPPLKLLINASSLKGLPLSMRAGSQASTFGGWLPPLSTLLCEVWVIFCYFVALWVSSSPVGWDLLVSTISFPFYSFFLFGSEGSGLCGVGGWGGGRGDLGVGGGSFGCAHFPDASLPSWDSIRSIRLLWFFLWMPISSEVVKSPCCWESRLVGISLEEGGWLNTSNSSEDSDKVTIPSGFSSSSSSSFSYPSSSSWRTCWDMDAPTEGMATKSGWVSGVPSGIRILLEPQILRRQH